MRVLVSTCLGTGIWKGNWPRRWTRSDSLASRAAPTETGPYAARVTPTSTVSVVPSCTRRVSTTNPPHWNATVTASNIFVPISIRTNITDRVTGCILLLPECWFAFWSTRPCDLHVQWVDVDFETSTRAFGSCLFGKSAHGRGGSVKFQYEWDESSRRKVASIYLIKVKTASNERPCKTTFFSIR